ncbi:nucleotidyltransferase family protein [Candidatus Finniella inopinata]|uniref:Nucleotidyltransferase family protein n=1 Tax=Candidatus Finniella inopinata TaxID=1696036 RepID=A0A4Q7DLC9_9PROT|nr:nucleotidyltransferase family protein [Candidatus Finniella inopinata]RZI47055.1 nucleotidyltransferase family protein [Candidatus Finniella inopinata]
MTKSIKQAMILAAGFGKRLRPLTDVTPKPLISIGSTTCLDETINRLHAVGVEKIVVNTHHLAKEIHQHLAEQPKILFSYEPVISETGGGIAKALKHFGDQPFVCINGDIWWQDSPTEPLLTKMADAWDPDTMDVLLAVVPKHQTIGYYGRGDYNKDDRSNLHLAEPENPGDYVYTGIQILSAEVFQKSRVWPHQTIFPVTKIFAEAEHRKRLHGLTHENLWADIGSPQGLEETRQKFGGEKEPAI